MTREPMISDFYTVSNRAPLPPVDTPSIPKTKEEIISRPFEAYGSCAALFSDEIRKALAASVPVEHRPRGKVTTSEYKGQRGETARVKDRRAALLAAFDEWLAPIQAIEKLKASGIILAPDNTVRADILALTRSGKLVAQGTGVLRMLIQTELNGVVEYVRPEPLGTTREIIERRERALAACKDWTKVSDLALAVGVKKSVMYEEVKRMLRKGVITGKFDYHTRFVKRTKKGEGYLK